MGKKQEKAWKYLLENRSATAKELSDAVDISYGYARSIIRRIGTPKEILNAPKKLTRSDVLDTAKNLVNGDRAEQHGDATNNFVLMAAYWNAHLGLRDFISVDDVPIMLALMKVARLHGDGTKNIDNYVDVCGYMSLGGEISQL